MKGPSNLPKVPMLGIALLQGICLIPLYRAAENGTWPSQSPMWAYPLWTVVLAVPVLLLLSTDRGNYARAVPMVAGFGAVLALLAVYTGLQATPHDAFPVDSLTFVFVVTTGLACFKALMYLQQRADHVPMTYDVLFTNSWRNFLIGALSAVFALIFWAILMLWGQLFNVIGIGFFRRLFTEDWFAIPVLSVAFGLGIVLFRGLTHVIDSITKLLHWLIKLLLPLVLAVAVIFLGALPFVGLDVLWETGRGTALLLWLLALVLFFTNAVYQDGRETKPYPVLVHRLIYAALCVTPVVAALSFYGLALRLAQYGWTVERAWAFVVCLGLTLFALGYVAGIARRRDAWTADLARVNTAMGLVVLALMLLTNSPLLDLRKIALASQLDRVESGDIELREFDFWYARQHLARPGYLAMQKMKADARDSDPELAAMIENPLPAMPGVRAEDTERMWSDVVYRPAPFEVPAALRPQIGGQLGGRFGGIRAEPVLFRVDLDEDGQPEYVLLMLYEDRIAMSQFFHHTANGWQQHHLSYDMRPGGADDLRKRILEGEIEFTPPRYRQLEVGGIAFQPWAR